MFSSRSFQIAIILSLLAHGAIMLRQQNFSLFPSPKSGKNPELRYIKKPKEEKPALKFTPSRKDPPLRMPENITTRKYILPDVINPNLKQSQARKKINALGQEGTLKPALARPDIIAIKKKISLPPVDLDKIDNPSYVSYYQIVREKIRRAAYQNYSRSEQGEVYLSFVISNNGYIKEARVVEERSSSNDYLIEASVRSIKDAAPFPNFPKDLDYQQLSFNVVISYEVGE